MRRKREGTWGPGEEEGGGGKEVVSRCLRETMGGSPFDYFVADIHM